MSRGMRYLGCIVTGAALAGVIPLGMTSVAAAGSATPQVLMRPSDSSGGVVPGPSYYVDQATPGQQLHLYAYIGNGSKQRVTVAVVPVDAATAVGGGVSYNLPAHPKTAVGAWIKVSRSRVTLGPKKATVVPFTVYVPKRATPGEYVGGLSAFVPITKGKKHQFGVVVQYRVVNAVEVTIPGPTVHHFKIKSVAVEDLPSGYLVVPHLVNTGNSLLSAGGHLYVWRVGQAHPIISKKLTVDTTVPETDVQCQVKWTKFPKAGMYTYRLVVTWDTGKAIKRGKFEVKR
jgi:hypothetical protein